MHKIVRTTFALTMCAAILVTAGCGENSQPGAPAGSPGPSSAPPIRVMKSTAVACKDIIARANPFYKALIDEAPLVKEGEPFPQAYIDKVHQTASEFVPFLRQLASDSMDPATRTVLETYADKVDSNLIKSVDLKMMTPENSAWLLDLGHLCEKYVPKSSSTPGHSHGEV